MTANWRPDLSWQISFNADPNDPGAVPVWVDLATRFRAAEQVTHGRQYELDETQAGAPTVLLEDIDEYLNPQNTSSPYWPNVDLYRRAILQAVWANDGTLANYLNTVAPVPGMQQTFYDGSFESYAAAAAVPWITAVGATVPVIGTTTPNTGTKDLTYPVAGTAVVQGVSFPVPCVPGRQYTCSAYVRQSSASTQSIRVTDQATVADDFNRTTASGYGTATFVGGAWSTIGAGAAADYFTTVAPSAAPWYGTASQSITAVNTRYMTSISSSIVDSDLRVLITVPAVATGGEIVARAMSRVADASNHYFADCAFQTDTTLITRVQRRVAGAATSLATATLPFTYAAGTQVWMRFQTVGGTLRTKVWRDGTAEPSAWSVSITDTTYTTGGALGLGGVLNAANTNTLPVVLVFGRFSAVGSVTGSTTTTTGSYVRLSVTWTATEPVHTIQVATSGTAVAGTVLVDDLQHEQGASATTLVTTGPVIYTPIDDYVERWPATWHPDSQGFEGLAAITCIDALALLNKTSLLAAYPQAVMSMAPAFFWPLWDSIDSIAFAEISGNGGPPLGLLVSKYGQGTLPAAGTPMGVLGDPGGTGVTFTPDTPPTSVTQAATIIGCGFGSTPGVVLPPGSPSNGWGMSVALWVKGALTSPASSPQLFRAFDPLPAGYVTPIGIVASTTGTLDAFLENYVAPTAHFLDALDVTVNVLDGAPHLVVATVSQNQGGTNTTMTLYIDSVQKASTTVTTASLGGVLATQVGSVVVGGGFDDTNGVSQVVDGSVMAVAIWNRVLSATEVVILGGPAAGAGGGWSGETSGERITRYLSGQLADFDYTLIGGYHGEIAIDTGMSVMGPDDLVSGTDVLTACQSVATTENGMFWAAPGAVSFADRERRYLETTSRYTLGEDSAGGEYPYLGDLNIDWDPTRVYNQIQITNADGIIATAFNATSIRRYSGQTFQRSINALDDNEAIDATNYLLAQYDRPHPRVATITLDPASNPDLWPFVLAIAENMRVTVKRRAKAANSGAGLTISGDYFIEKVTHAGINMGGPDGGDNSWLVYLEMSPVGVSQVWILDDTTYSVLGSTTILGY